MSTLEFPSKDSGSSVALITRNSQHPSNTQKYITNVGARWNFATPLTYEEVRALTPQAPSAPQAQEEK